MYEDKIPNPVPLSVSGNSCNSVAGACGVAVRPKTVEEWFTEREIDLLRQLENLRKKRARLDGRQLHMSMDTYDEQYNLYRF